MEEHVRDYLDDPYMVGVEPAMADTIGQLVETYGDEALRQIALFCLGKWFAVHSGIVEQFVENDQINKAMASIMDATRISDAIALLESVGSFGGDEHWRQMLHESVVGAVNDAMNQQEL